MPASYIPTKDALLVPWSNNFSALLTAAPTSYGLTAGDASAYAALDLAYDNAYAAAISGSTRGPSSVATKDAAKANLIARARQLATIIQANPAITDAQKTDLGLTVRKTTKTPVPPPSTSPLLTFVAATPGQHTLRMADQLTPALKAKPFGVIQLQLRYWLTTTPPPAPQPGPPSAPTGTVLATKNPFAVNFDSAATGKTVFYIGNWLTRKGEIGPDSNVVQQVVI